MVHLTNQKTIALMVFFSLITYFIGPLLTRPFLQNHPDQCVAGYSLGFFVSVVIWMKYGRHFVKK